MADFVGAVDQGTTSTRFMVFDHEGNEVAKHQLEHQQFLPRAGWVEHDPLEIWDGPVPSSRTALAGAGLDAADLAALGITNQRETTVVWDRRTGRPVRQRHRLAGHPHRPHRDRAGPGRARRGDPPQGRTAPGRPTSPAARSSGSWRTSTGCGRRPSAATPLFGTIDTWLIWNLTGGTAGGVHVTDVTNASRTMLMDLETLDWDDELLSFFGIPRAMLPEIRPSSDPAGYGTDRARAAPRRRGTASPATWATSRRPRWARCASRVGEAKNTYGTGNFLLLNTGTELVRSKHGLLTTVCYQLGDTPATYALEGSIAVTGSAVQWLRDQLGIISGAAESEALARQVPDTGGDVLRARLLRPVRAVLALRRARGDRGPLPVPHQRAPGPGHPGGDRLPDPRRGRGDGAGLGRRARRAEGGRRRHRQRPVHAAAGGHPRRAGVRPVVAETTALGAAYAAGLAVGFWRDTDDLRRNWREDRRWEPRWTADQRESGYAGWKKAVERTLDWVEVD